MKSKGLSFVILSLLAMQGYAAEPIVPLWQASFGRTLERQIVRELSAKTLGSLKTVVPTPLKELSFNVFYPSDAQIAMLKQQYNTSILAAQQLTHELFPSVFYADVLSPQQINQNLADITRVDGMLLQIDLFINGEDIPLLNAQENMKRLMRYFSSIGSGQVMNWYQFKQDNNPLFQRQDRVFDKEEFFLKEPEGVSRNDAAFALPRQLKVAILNDDEDILKGLMRMKRIKEASLWEIDGFLSPEEFLNQTDVRSYDLVLTDVNIRPGGGDYLAFRLRQMGYREPILAISGYDEEPFLAERLYIYGIDGMYAAGTVAAMRVPRIHAVVLDKIKNYFYYKGKGKWER